MMVKLGFAPSWVQLAMDKVITASYSVLINGEPKSFITLIRGIRQGDPFSPYLFLMCVEGLSALARKVGETRGSKRIKSAKMEYGYLTSSLPTIAFYFVKQQWRKAKNYYNCWHSMRLHPVKQSTDKRLPSFLARTRSRW